MNRVVKKYMTLKVRIPVIIVLSLLILGTSIIAVSFKRYEELNVEKHIKMAEGITTLMADRFDVEKIDYYVDNNYSSDEYMQLLKYYYTIKDSYLDVEYMYIYRVFRDESDGVVKGLVIVDLDEEYTEDVPQESIDWIGSLYILDAKTAENFETMTSGKESFWEITTDGEGGARLLSYIRPILDSEGNYACSACVDFSLNAMYGKGIKFIIELLAVIFFVILGVIAIVNILLSAILFKPLKKMTRCIESFKFDTDKDRYDNLVNMEALNIQLNNEIDELYDALILSLKDSAYYMQRLNTAKNQIEEISETAYKDALTGVGSKTAYNGAIAKLQEEVDQHILFCFGFVMVDINNLKYVNDTYGHELGDSYIKGSCRIICDIFKHSPVFRTGGDEFVVILTGDAYDSREKLAEDLESAFSVTYNNDKLEPYCRYSASFGIAIFDPLCDKSVAETLKRADQRMYEYKKEFKKVHGSYR